jgi:hypothetical protein
MPLFVKFAYGEAVLPFGGFLGVVLWMLLTGSIPLSYLLDGDVRDPNSAHGFSSQASTGRAQTLVVTLFVAGYDLLQVVRNPTELPQLPVPMVMALGASHAFYLAGKTRDRFKGR